MYFFLFFLPAILFAGEIQTALHFHNDFSVYEVWNDDQKTLSSRLEFPSKFLSIDVAYKRNFFYETSLEIFGSTVVSSQTTTGKDYDWKEDELTVFSFSKNDLKAFYNLSMKIEKSFFLDYTFYLKYSYKYKKQVWSDTIQSDYVKNTTQSLSQTTLQFQETLSQIYLGINYSKELSHGLFLNISPSISYNFIATQDDHLLRNFYVQQNINTFGYMLEAVIGCQINKTQKIVLKYQYEYLYENEIEMKYYLENGVSFASYPSSYTLKNNALAVVYIIQF